MTGGTFSETGIRGQMDIASRSRVTNFQLTSAGTPDTLGSWMDRSSLGARTGRVMFEMLHRSSMAGKICSVSFRGKHCEDASKIWIIQIYHKFV